MSKSPNINCIFFDYGRCSCEKVEDRHCVLLGGDDCIEQLRHERPEPPPALPRKKLAGVVSDELKKVWGKEPNFFMAAGSLDCIKNTGRRFFVLDPGDPRNVHTVNAAIIFGIPVGEVTEEQRKVAKRALYQKMYSPERRETDEDDNR